MSDEVSDMSESRIDPSQPARRAVVSSHRQECDGASSDLRGELRSPLREREVFADLRVSDAAGTRRLLVWGLQDCRAMEGWRGWDRRGSLGQGGGGGVREGELGVVASWSTRHAYTAHGL